MRIIVQKFGGTSLKTEEGRKLAAHHVHHSVQNGYKVIAVVSAMGRKGDPYATDTLLDLVDIRLIDKRERDLLMSCGEIISAVKFKSVLRSLGLRAAAVTGAKAGIVTNDEFTNARIIRMNVEPLIEMLEMTDVVVVAGFQGMTESGDVTTLGRGGSDTTATAIGAAVKAEYVDIFTDVAGVMTADPAIVKDAKPLEKVTFSEICNMAYQGAKVIHPRAVEIAMQAKIPVRIRSTFSNDKGTLLTNERFQDRLVTSITHMPNITQIKVFAKEGQFDLQEKVFKAMANENISVDFININPFGVVYTVMDEETDRAVNVLQKMGYEPEIKKHCAKISIVGAGMSGVPGVTAKIVEVLAKENIPILQSADSHTTIWVLVKNSDVVRAVNALHEAFRLNGS